MASVFYDHLIDWGRLDSALNALGLDKEQKLEYLEEIEHTLHTEMLVLIIENLAPEHHEGFIDRFHAAPHDAAHLHFLVEVCKPDIEISIHVKANQIISHIIIDLD